jgi:hypothetical protein
MAHPLALTESKMAQQLALKESKMAHQWYNQCAWRSLEGWRWKNRYISSRSGTRIP